MGQIFSWHTNQISEVDRNTQLDRRLGRYHRDDKKKTRVVILGQKLAGKTTCYKQLTKLVNYINHGITPNQNDIVIKFSAKYINKTTALNFRLARTRYEFVDSGDLGHQARIGDPGRKTLHHFSDASGIFFVVDLSSYDVTEQIPSGQYVNSLVLALQQFSEVVNSQEFKNSTVILVLNKHDLFQAKVKAGIPLNFRGSRTRDIPPRFLDYQDDTDVVCISHYIEDRFLELVRRPPSGAPVHVIYMNALDDTSFLSGFVYARKAIDEWHARRLDGDE